MQLAAVSEMLAGLVVDGFEAEVALVRGLAALADERPNDTDVWREYRMALKMLREVLSRDSAPPDELVALFERLGGAALRDTADSN